MTIYFYPYNNESNKYVENFKEILSESDEVKELRGPKGILKKIFLKNTRKDIVFLNWVEDVSSGCNFFVFGCWFIYVIMLKVLFKKIYWVRHNFSPHNHSNLKRYKLICSLLSYISDFKITHRPVDGYKYIPHPSYSKKSFKINNENRDVDYLFFGVIKRYKGLVKLLNNWPKDKKLYIRGLCDDEELNKEILFSIEKKGLCVDYINGFLSDSELEELLQRTKFVVIPHTDNRMIVSGTFYHAATYGTNFLLLESEFSDYLKSKFTFTHYLDDERIPVKSGDVIKEFYDACGKDVIKKYLNEIL